MNKKYYSLVEENNEATLNIYGEITSWEWSPNDISSYTLSKQLESIEANTINVYINSYGGEVAEGLAIYNALKRHKAKVITYVDGFACSIASVIFMAGDERIMSNSSLLMIHNAWAYTAGNANELRKMADDLDIMTQASINAYMLDVNITEEELKQLLDNETWLSPQLALEMNFCSSIVNEKNSDKASQSVKKSLFKMIFSFQDDDEKSDDKDNEDDEDDDLEKDDKKEPKESLMGSFFNALLK
ncbi:head maturation protease, ClpP-related [uncultured Clostridium sp.]|uniref:head maturation protease, ClpP-related n=1 Tax=uncultured Clostridium sp. TaxID=59620 RepID=UPI0026232AB3|nr:head maturation protease, ClpP-related [uncultured Clostridium sp.]MCI9110894.1 Clp protease ClpP [Bacilli bacterium]